jgi:hypothetical protein
MYVLSRTTGPPVGPHAGHAEAAGLIDVATTAGELVAGAALLALLPRALARRVTTVLLLTGLALWTLRLTGGLV